MYPRPQKSTLFPYPPLFRPASSASLDPPLLTERQIPRRSAVLVITSDRGFAGSYNVNVLRRTEELLSLLRQEGKEPVLYVVGRKGETYYSFRNRRSEEHTSELQSRQYLVCRLLLEKKKILII